VDRCGHELPRCHPAHHREAVGVIGHPFSREQIEVADDTCRLAGIVQDEDRMDAMSGELSRDRRQVRIPTACNQVAVHEARDR
jgi:hypothetical protein